METHHLVQIELREPFALFLQPLDFLEGLMFGLLGRVGGGAVWSWVLEGRDAASGGGGGGARAGPCFVTPHPTSAPSVVKRSMESA